MLDHTTNPDGLVPGTPNTTADQLHLTYSPAVDSQVSEWSPATTYRAGQYVSAVSGIANDSPVFLYRALRGSTNAEPRTSTMDWQQETIEWNYVIPNGVNGWDSAVESVRQIAYNNIIEGWNEDNMMQMLNLSWNVDASACLLYTSPSPRDATLSRMPSSA